MNLFLLQSSNRNFPSDTQKALQDLGCSLVLFRSLSEIMETPLRKSPFVCVLEVGGAEELDRAYLAQEWCETIQPFSRAKFIYLLASKHILVDESKTRGAEIVHLPVVPRNLLFKIELQHRLLEKEPEKKLNALGFRGERIQPEGEKKRVFSFTGPRKGKWESAGLSPSGKVRWRWISSEPMDVSKTFGLSWISRSDAPPKLEEASGQWQIEGEDGDVLCQKNGTDLISLREQLVRGKALPEEAAEVRKSGELLEEAGEQKKSASASSEESRQQISGKEAAEPTVDVVKSTTMSPEEELQWKNRQGQHFERSQPVRESKSEREEEARQGKRREVDAVERISPQEKGAISEEEIQVKKKVTTDTLSTLTHSKGGEEFSLAKQTAGPGEEEKNTQKNLEQSTAFSSLGAALSPPEKKEEALASTGRLEDPAARGERAKPQERAGEKKSRPEQARAEQSERPDREAPEAHSREERERADLEKGLRERSERERQQERAAREQSSRAPSEKAEPPPPKERNVQEKESVSPAPAKQQPSTKEALDLPKEGEPTQRSGGGVSKNASVILVEGKTSQENKERERFSRAEEEKKVSSFSQSKQGEKFFDPLSQRAFFIVSLAELNDQNSVWYPVDGYRIYLSAEARYKDFSKIDFFPLWIYQGELAPEFLEQEKAWKFYDRPPEVRADAQNLPEEILRFLQQDRLEISAEILEVLRKKGTPMEALFASGSSKKGFLAWVKRLLGF